MNHSRRNAYPSFGTVEPERQARQPARVRGDRGPRTPSELALARRLYRKLQVGAVRRDLVARTRAMIAGGQYETVHRLSEAVERLLDDLD